MGEGTVDNKGRGLMAVGHFVSLEAIRSKTESELETLFLVIKYEKTITYYHW